MIKLKLWQFLMVVCAMCIFFGNSIRETAHLRIENKMTQKFLDFKETHLHEKRNHRQEVEIAEEQGRLIVTLIESLNVSVASAKKAEEKALELEKELRAFGAKKE